MKLAISGESVRSLWSKAPTATASSRLAVTLEHAICLAAMLDRPTRYRQRCLDQVSFLPGGGQRWLRTLQTQIPKTAEPDGTDWRIVSLGEYDRRRFPDFTITDEHSGRLNRLTRRQHGVALTRAMLASHFFTLPKKRWRQFRKTQAHEAYVGLRDHLFDLFTSVEEIDDLETLLKAVVQLFANLLISAKVPRVTCEERELFNGRLDAFAYDLADGIEKIQYLCWVKASPGQILNLQVSWTVSDPLSELVSRGGFVAGAKAIVKKGLSRTKDMRRKGWMRWYCEFGLAPMSYMFEVPVTGSYYFTLEPPVKTDVMYLDWEESNSFEDTELDSGFAAAHLHDRDMTRHDRQPYAVRAYVRCRTREHKQIAAGALLNVAFVMLAARGRFTSSIGTSAQTWLLVTPTILIAYLANQQRHYYAHTTRRQRAILWIYLAISVVFLVAISFSLSHGVTNSQHWGWFATRVAWLFIAGSAAVATYYTPLGYNYQLATEKSARAGLSTKDTRPPLLKIGGRRLQSIRIGRRRLQRRVNNRETWVIYDDAIRKYCNRVFRTLLIIPSIVLAVTIGTWQYSHKHKVRYKPRVARSVQQGTLTTTAWPSEYCKGEGCNVEFRFVPTAGQ